VCGRITQYRSNVDYAAEIGWRDKLFRERADDPVPNWNVAPGSHPWLMHQFDDGQEGFDRVHWGYRPTWAAEKGIPMAINARIEKAATGPFFRHLWKSGRVIVPADGWYEWTGEPRHKQPWYIRLKDDRPMLMAAITNFRPDKELHDGSGFVIVTAAADAGMVDVHDRRPVVFSAEDAQLWLDPALSPQQAEQLARSMVVPAEAFEWYQVSKEVNKVGKSDPHLIEPIPYARD
jgi:putative SOS response-associated peptidase YedK